jgi:hypothetical protein
MQARYDCSQPGALKQLVAAKTKVVPFPQAVLDASFKATMGLYADLDKSNPDWKKIYADYAQFPARSDPLVPLCRVAFRQLHVVAKAIMKGVFLPIDCQPADHSAGHHQRGPCAARMVVAPAFVERRDRPRGHPF